MAKFADWLDFRSLPMKVLPSISDEVSRSFRVIKLYLVSHSMATGQTDVMEHSANTDC